MRPWYTHRRMDSTLAEPARTEILARWSTPDSASRRLCNVVGVALGSLLVELDDETTAPTSILVTFIVPGTADRVTVAGELEPAGAGAVRTLRMSDPPPPVLEAYVQRRTAAPVTRP